MIFGEVTAPRGLKIKEQQNWSWTFPAHVRWANFESRKLSLDYIRAELRWYLRGDPYDQTIAQHAKKWAEIRNPDGSVNSNYGHYLFRQGGLGWVLDELARDTDTRRASALILNRTHLIEGNNDVPCTYGLNFRIRRDKLFCSVHMRSQDAVWGLCNDLPFFSVVQEIVAAIVGIPMGPLHLAVDSFHVYERHWKMLDDIHNVMKPCRWNPVDCPPITEKIEAWGLLFDSPRMEYPFTRWLYQPKEEPCIESKSPEAERK